jgi:hypothetical protein
METKRNCTRKAMIVWEQPRSEFRFNGDFVPDIPASHFPKASVLAACSTRAVGPRKSKSVLMLPDDSRPTRTPHHMASSVVITVD